MKKCEHFKDLILTDYIDGELDKNLRATVENHLLDCHECRAFFKEVKNDAALVIQSTRQKPVPTELWSAIKQNIEHENQVSSPIADFMAQLKGLFFFPRIVPIFASLVLMFIAGSVTFNTIQVQQAQLKLASSMQAKDQGEYLISMLSPTSTQAPSDNNDLGTPIEHYFL